MKEQFYNELSNLVSDIKSVKFLLAVSGGRDSVALAHLFARCGLPFNIAHCNFHLRGEESNNEMRFVQNLPFLTTHKVFVKEFDTITLHQNSGKSIEMVARELRYEWFDEIGKEYDYIVTAHHANDNAETMLLNLIRGTGLRGMCGIPSINGKIIRPLLMFKSIEIDFYCREHKLKYCIDSSNLLDLYLRNKIRNHVIPELEKISPNFIETFSKNSKLFQQQTLFFDENIHSYKNQLLKETRDRITIDIELLKNMKSQSLILYELLSPFGFNAVDVENIQLSIGSISGKQFISETHILVKDRKQLIIEKNEMQNDELFLFNNIHELEKCGFTVNKLSTHNDFVPIKDSKMIYVDAKKLVFPLTLRGWQDGDFFYPFGMKRKKKLSDFFTDEKIDILQKQKIRLLCSQNQIIWIINYRADDRFRVDLETEYYYEITMTEKCHLTP